MFSSGSMYSFCVLTTLLDRWLVITPLNMDHILLFIKRESIGHIPLPLRLLRKHSSHANTHLRGGVEEQTYFLQLCLPSLQSNTR